MQTLTHVLMAIFQEFLGWLCTEMLNLLHVNLWRLESAVIFKHYEIFRYSFGRAAAKCVNV